MLPVSRWLCTCICTLRYNSDQLSHLRATSDWLVNGLVWNITESSSCSLTTSQRVSRKPGGGGGVTRTIFGYNGWAAEGLKRAKKYIGCLRQRGHKLCPIMDKRHVPVWAVEGSIFPPPPLTWARACYNLSWTSNGSYSFFSDARGQGY